MITQYQFFNNDTTGGKKPKNGKKDQCFRGPFQDASMEPQSSPEKNCYQLHPELRRIHQDQIDHSSGNSLIPHFVTTILKCHHPRFTKILKNYLVNGKPATCNNCIIQGRHRFEEQYSIIKASSKCYTSFPSTWHQPLAPPYWNGPEDMLNPLTFNRNHCGVEHLYPRSGSCLSFVHPISSSPEELVSHLCQQPSELSAVLNIPYSLNPHRLVFSFSHPPHKIDTREICYPIPGRPVQGRGIFGCRCRGLVVSLD